MQSSQPRLQEIAVLKTQAVALQPARVDAAHRPRERVLDLDTEHVPDMRARGEHDAYRKDDVPGPHAAFVRAVAAGASTQATTTRCRWSSIFDIWLTHLKPPEWGMITAMAPGTNGFVGSSIGFEL